MIDSKGGVRLFINKWMKKCLRAD